MLFRSKFQIVKKNFFPNSWKVGLSYRVFDSEQVTYEHYPIPLDKNDVQIKHIDDNLEKEIRKTRLELIAYFKENPIKTDPKSLAEKYVKDKLEKILKHHLLDHRIDETLAREFVFAFIDHFNVQMGLGEKDIYSLQEIEVGFFKYFPLWVTEVSTIPHINSLYSRFGFHDPSLYLSTIPPKSRIEIAEKVQEKLKNNSEIPRVLMGNEKYQFVIFVDMLNYLKSQNINEIKRIFKKGDFTRLQTKASWIWNAFSRDDVVNNLKIFFENYRRIYNAIIEKNFPNLKNELSLFYGSNYVIVVYDVKDEYSGPVFGVKGPSIYMYFFTSERKQGLEINIISKEDFDKTQIIEEINSKNQIFISGQTFQYLTQNWSILEFIYEDRPIFHFLYDDLQCRFKNYFR